MINSIESGVQYFITPEDKLEIQYDGGQGVKIIELVDFPSATFAHEKEEKSTSGSLYCRNIRNIITVFEYADNPHIKEADDTRKTLKSNEVQTEAITFWTKSEYMKGWMNELVELYADHVARHRLGLPCGAMKLNPMALHDDVIYGSSYFCMHGCSALISGITAMKFCPHCGASFLTGEKNSAPRIYAPEQKTCRRIVIQKSSNNT